MRDESQIVEGHRWREVGWRSMETCPRDGTWVILYVEYGGHVWSPHVGRWNPCEGVGGTYEWEVVQQNYLEDQEVVTVKGVFNNYADGSVSMWIPLPGTP